MTIENNTKIHQTIRNLPGHYLSNIDDALGEITPGQELIIFDQANIINDHLKMIPGRLKIIADHNQTIFDRVEIITGGSGMVFGTWLIISDTYFPFNF